MRRSKNKKQPTQRGLRGFGRKHKTSSVSCSCCAKTLPWALEAYGTAYLVETHLPEQVQAILYTLYSSVSADFWGRTDGDLSYNELDRINCVRCGTRSGLLYLMPLTAQDGYCTKPYCNNCIVLTVGGGSSDPVRVIKLDRRSHTLRALVRQYRKAYLKHAANSAEESQPITGMSF